MYIIPYFLENEAKKLLKVKISKVINNVTDELISNIFNCKPDSKYNDFIINLEDSVKKSVLNIIKEIFDTFDKLYVNTKERKKQFNISDSKCHRNILTIFGPLDFERIYYYDKNENNKYFFLVDTLFNLPKHDRYDKIVKGMAIENAISTNQKLGAKITNDYINSILSKMNSTTTCHISRQDIYNWIDKWEVPEIEYEAIETEDDILYIMIDEKYIHEQIQNIINKENNNSETKTITDIKKEYLDFIDILNNPPLMLPAPKKKTKSYIMSKAFITFTDIKKNKKRRELVNKNTFLTTSKNAWSEFMDHIVTIYDFKQFKTIKVLSDAGTWILSGIPNLKLFSDNVIVPCLCEFHVKQKVNRITKDEQLRSLLNKAINDDNKEEFNKLIDVVLEGKTKKRQEKIKEYKKYIINHWNSIKEMKKSKYKSSMESHISHCIAKYFSYEPKAYSKRHIQKLIKLKEYQLNGISIFKLYLKTCNNKEKITIKKEELNFSIFENNSSNVPILQSGDSYTRLALSQLCS